VALGQTSRLGPEMGCALRAGSEAAGLGPETDRALPARGRVGGAGEGAWRRVSASRRRRNGRVAPYAAARLTGRARGRAGRQNAGNSPAHPTSLFSPQSARGEPRHVGCSAPSTTSARPHALFRGFSYKNFAGFTGPIARRRAAALRRRRQGWAQRQAGRCAHGGGLVGKGRPRVSPALHGRNGRVAAFAAARLTGRARGRAGRKNADNSPAHLTSLFSPQSARREPRHVGCSALSTTSARSAQLHFSAGTCATEGSLASNPMRGDKMRVFSPMCARCWGWLPMSFFAKRRFFGGLCYNFFGTQGWNLSPHCRAGKWHQGDQMRQKNSPADPRKTRTELFFKKNPPKNRTERIFFKKYIPKIRGVASSFSAGAAFSNTCTRAHVNT